MSIRVMTIFACALACGSLSGVAHAQGAAAGGVPAFQHVPLTGGAEAQAKIWQAVGAWRDARPGVARQYVAAATKAEPDMVVGHILRAELSWRPEERKRALDQAVQAARKARLHPWEKVWLTITQLKFQGKAGQALRQYDRLIRAQPNEPYFFVFRGLAHLRQGTPASLEKARLDFEKATALWPSCRAAWNLLGYVHVSQGRVKEALDALTRYVQLAPRLANPHDSLAEVLLRGKRYIDAANEYRTALRLDPRAHGSRLGLGYTLVNMGLNRRRATAYVAQGRKELELAMAKSPEPRDKVIALELLAISYLLEGQDQRAVANLKRYVKWAQLAKNPELLAEAQLFSAAVHVVRGAYRDAHRSCEAATVTLKDPRVSTGHRLLMESRGALLKAIMLLELGEVRAADGRLRSIAWRDAPGAVKQLAADMKAVRLLYGGDSRRAVTMLARADENRPLALYYLGRAQVAANDPAGPTTLKRAATSTVLDSWSALWRVAARAELRGGR